MIPNTQRRAFFGLGQRLAFLVGLALSVAIAVVAAIAIVRDVALLRSAFFESGLHSTELVAPTLGGAVRFARPDNIEPVLADFRTGQEETVAWIAVVDAAGQPLVTQNHLSQASPAAVAEALAAVAASGGAVRAGLVTAAPVRFGPEEAIVGTMVVGWSDAVIAADERATALELAAIGAGLALGFAALAYLVLARFVARPIRSLDRALTGLAAGDFAQAVPGQTRGDEIGAMARNLELLRAALADGTAQRAKLKAVEQAAGAEREAMIAALRNGVGAVVAAAQAGDFARRVEQRFDDPTLQSLADGVNAICEVIARFLADGEAAITALSHGDLSHAMSDRYAGRLDEFARAVNATLAGLKRLVQELQETQAGISATVAEIARDSEDLSQRAIVQATALQQTSATMTELSTTIRANADNAHASAEAVGDARGRADTSRVLIDKAVAAMKEIQGGTQQITEIVDAIDGFAFQTNLLALNAAVEAARAGDAGKGFAVVASEVRTLAQRAADAAKDIRRLIRVSQASVDNGAAVVDATGTALSDILTSFVAIAPAMSDISNATREQSLGVGELTATLGQIDDATQRNASLAEKGAHEAQTLRTQADSLARLIAFFVQDAPVGYLRAAE